MKRVPGNLATWGCCEWRGLGPLVVEASSRGGRSGTLPSRVEAPAAAARAAVGRAAIAAGLVVVLCTERVVMCGAPSEKAGGEVVEAACVIELPFLHGRAKIPDTPLFVLVEKEGL